MTNPTGSNGPNATVNFVKLDPFVTPSDWLVGSSEVIFSEDGTINGVPVVQIQSKMRPLENPYESPYLGDGELFAEVIQQDDNLVASLGLTHAQLGGFLQQFCDAQNEFAKSMFESMPLGELPKFVDRTGNSDNYGNPTCLVELPDGSQFGIRAKSWRGLKDSPFLDGEATHSDYTLTDLQTGDTLTFSGLIPKMVGKYGFYEGNVSYRVEPRNIALMAGVVEKVIDPNDPIVQLTSGQTQSIVLETYDQVKRYANLVDAGLPEALEADVEISLNSTKDLFTFLQDTNLYKLWGTMSSVRGELTPEPIEIKSGDWESGLKYMLEQFPETERNQIMGLMSRFDFPESEFNEKEHFLRGLFREIDGSDASKPYAALVLAVENDPYEIAQAMYVAAGGMRLETFRDGVKQVEDRLNEDRARILIEEVGEKIIPLVDQHAEELGVSPDQPFADKALDLLKQFNDIPVPSLVLDNPRAIG